MTPTRARSIRRSLKLLGVSRATAFLRAANREADGVLAVQMINEALDRGEELEAILLDGDKYGYHLVVKRRSRDQFSIDFACVPGEMLGDGGDWEVKFDAAGEVVSCEGGIVWIS